MKTLPNKLNIGTLLAITTLTSSAQIFNAVCYEFNDATEGWKDSATSNASVSSSYVDPGSISRVGLGSQSYDPYWSPKDDSFWFTGGSSLDYMFPDDGSGNADLNNPIFTNLHDNPDGYFEFSITAVNLPAGYSSICLDTYAFDMFSNKPSPLGHSVSLPDPHYELLWSKDGYSTALARGTATENVWHGEDTPDSYSGDLGDFCISEGETVTFRLALFNYLGSSDSDVEFTQPNVTYTTNDSYLNGLDNLKLTAHLTAVPEPSTSILSLSALGLLFIRRRN